MPEQITVTVDDVRAYVEAREAMDTYDHVPYADLAEAYGPDLDEFLADLFRTVAGVDAPLDYVEPVLLAEVDRLREALQAIASHPCPNRDCCCGPAPEYHSMGRIARMALGLPEPAEEGS